MAADDTKARLDKVRAERAALAVAREARAADAALEAQLEGETLALRDEQAIAAAELEHGPVGKRIAVIGTDLGVVIVKRPHAALFRKFQAKGSTKPEDLDQLVRPCLVYPSKAEFDRIDDELPATMTRCANAVVALAGFRQEENAGKS
jgi:hypothetical protein